MFKDSNNKHIKWTLQVLQMKRYQVPKILQSFLQTAATESFLKALHNAAVAAFSHLLQNLQMDLLFVTGPLVRNFLLTQTIAISSMKSIF